MRDQLIQDILKYVQRPSSYLGTEINRIEKDAATIRLHMALIYPDLYEIGTSHFGMQILYHLLNRHPEIWVERLFAPDTDLQARLRSSQTPLFTLESRTPLAELDILGFSLLYELNYTNILSILDLARIPFLANDRNDAHPFVIAGGPCTCNPEPVADFFDAIVIGDGEEVLERMAMDWLLWKKNPRAVKQDLLKTWSRIEGVYVPSFFKASYDSSGFQYLERLNPGAPVIKRAILADLESAFFPEAPTLPFGRPVHDRLRLEIARGCTRGCRFCQAGMIYRPVRERTPEKLLSLAEASLKQTGYTDISLLSLSTGDYNCISLLLVELMEKYASRHVAVSLPSLRAGTLTPEVMELIKRVRKTGFTIAPEAGSQRLRDVINKNITQEDILQTVEDAFRLGWQVIKLYFMIGLPTETDDDLKAIVSLIKQVKQRLGPKKTKKKINVSFTTFIPKPHVPFQWASQISLETSQNKLRWLKQQLKSPGVFVKWQDPKVSLLEGLFARGDRRLSNVLIAAYYKGCQFDGWSDRFNFEKWRETFAEAQIDPDFYTTRKRSLTEPLPWDHIDAKVDRSFLTKEWEAAFNESLTPDCRNQKCHQCGVCDFKSIKPVIAEVHASALSTQTSQVKQAATDPLRFKEIEMIFAKQDEAIFFGHLELVNIFLKAFARIGLNIQHSEGFHPKPKIHFEDALPIGIASLNEKLYITIDAEHSPHEILTAINQTLPAGLNIHHCDWFVSDVSQKKIRTASYAVTINEEIPFNAKELKQFQEAGEVMLTKINRKGNRRQTNLKDIVKNIHLPAPSTVRMDIETHKEQIIRPQDILQTIFNLPQTTLEKAAIVKL